MITTTTLNKPLWSALAEFEVKPECELDYLKGAKGGYVHAFASANTALELADRVGAALTNLDLIPRKLEGIEQIYESSTLSHEWTALCAKASTGGDVVFGEFFLYDQEADTTLA